MSDKRNEYFKWRSENGIVNMTDEAHKALSGSGDSALIELREALYPLTMNHDVYSSLQYAAEQFDNLSSFLSKTNSALGGSCDECSTLLYKIQEKVLTIINDLVIAVNQYAETSLAGEQQATNAAQQYNDSANSMLSELDSIEL